MNPTELKTRTKKFALRIIKLAGAIPKSDDTGRVIAKQIVRSGTSVAANYRATCRAHNRAEFIAKIGIVEAEADETALWLELLIESGTMTDRKLEEANEVAAIMAAARKTVSGK